jgi:hypothetical protein
MKERKPEDDKLPLAYCDISQLSTHLIEKYKSKPITKFEGKCQRVSN